MKEKVSKSQSLEENKGLKLPERLAGYSKKQSDFMVALLDCGIVIEACKKSGVSERCAYKWLKDGLEKELQEIRANLIEKDLNRLQLACGLAVNTLIEVMQDDKAPRGIKVNASRAVLDNIFKCREQEQIINKLSLLQEAFTRAVEDKNA